MDRILIDFAAEKGAVKPLHAVNNGPVKARSSQGRGNSDIWPEMGAPYARTHDTAHCYSYGLNHTIDISGIFPNFDADETDPASYDFQLTDIYIANTYACGTEIFYRLGESIDHRVKKYHVHPPKDYAKWARICEHIIRHYNEGWANGFAWNIEYWEIWNESDAESTKTWAGTQQQFIEFYTVAARHLKSCFPHLKIGGCGFTGSHPENVERFLRAIAERGVPLDFFSFHTYSATPARPVALWQHFRDTLCDFGYNNAEIWLDEWNYMGAWDPINQPLYYPAMTDPRGACYYAAMLCAMHSETDIAGAAYFEATPVKEFCGIFNVREMRVSIRNGATMEPTKGFYAFKSFNSLYRMGEEVAVCCDNESIHVLAAAGDCGHGMMIVNQGIEPVDLHLSLTGCRTDLVLRLTDPMRTNEVVRRILCEKSPHVSLFLPAQSFLYVGTDLPDLVPTYDKDCYAGVSVAPPKGRVNDLFE